MKHELKQFAIVCLDDDGNEFEAFTKGENKAHARSIIQTRIQQKYETTIKAALGKGVTAYKAIAGRIRRVRWTMPSL